MISSLNSGRQKGERERKKNAPEPGRVDPGGGGGAGSAPHALLGFGDTSPVGVRRGLLQCLFNMRLKKKKNLRRGWGGRWWWREEGDRRGFGGGKQEGSCEPVWG